MQYRRYKKYSDLSFQPQVPYEKKNHYIKVLRCKHNAIKSLIRLTILGANIFPLRLQIERLLLGIEMTTY